TTTPWGRDPKIAGYPIKISEALAQLEGSVYIERVTVNSPKNTIKAKRAIKKGFQTQIENKGFSLVEVLSMCPTGWGVNPTEAVKWIEENLIPVFPLGVIKDKNLTAKEDL
ncbi:MAG TPA: 2-oxoglutarate oxidoreductase, partial [bacterium]|nr:2-oxoglutarate oxidoreductase [bacterium]